MIVVLDAMAASYGGIAVYTENLVAGWARAFPDDELHVVLEAGTDWWPLPTGSGVARVVRHDIRLPRPAMLSRPLILTAVLPRLARRVGAEGIVAANPASTVLPTRVPLAVVSHDLRHELRPDQFPRRTRVVRTVVHRHGLRTADLVIAVSQRTAGDLRTQRPRLPADRCVVVVEGSDHTDAWVRGPAHGKAIAFGHHSNKNFDLILDAWTEMGAHAPALIMVGLGGAIREHVTATVAARGLGEVVELAPYLAAPDFQAVMTGARLVVFPTDFEGFGLPVVEAMKLRIPVVIGPEPACLEVADGHATVMADWTPAALADAVQRALVLGADEVERAGQHADTYTWAATAAGIRSALQARRRY